MEESSVGESVVYQAFWTIDQSNVEYVTLVKRCLITQTSPVSAHLERSASLQAPQGDPSFGERPTPEDPTDEGPETVSAPREVAGLPTGTRAWTQTKPDLNGQPIGRRSAGSHERFTQACYAGAPGVREVNRAR